MSDSGGASRVRRLDSSRWANVCFGCRALYLSYQSQPFKRSRRTELDSGRPLRKWRASRWTLDGPFPSLDTLTGLRCSHIMPGTLGRLDCDVAEAYSVCVVFWLLRTREPFGFSQEHMQNIPWLDYHIARVLN
jgi:hypothetical protein